MKEEPAKKNERLILANERTFLAWIRTSISIISLGFVVAKFSVWLGEMAVRADPQAQPHSTETSLPIGVTMMTLGGMLAVFAAWRYHIVNGEIERGVMRPTRGFVILLTTMVAMLAVAMIVYMLLTANHG